MNVPSFAENVSMASREVRLRAMTRTLRPLGGIAHSQHLAGRQQRRRLRPAGVATTTTVKATAKRTEAVQ